MGGSSSAWRTAPPVGAAGEVELTLLGCAWWGDHCQYVIVIINVVNLTPEHEGDGGEKSNDSTESDIAP